MKTVAIAIVKPSPRGLGLRLVCPATTLADGRWVLETKFIIFSEKDRLDGDRFTIAVAPITTIRICAKLGRPATDCQAADTGIEVISGSWKFNDLGSAGFRSSVDSNGTRTLRLFNAAL